VISLKELGCFDTQDIINSFRELNKDDTPDAKIIEIIDEIMSEMFYESLKNKVNDRCSGIY
jgi:hypothetical protein